MTESLNQRLGIDIYVISVRTYVDRHEHVNSLAKFHNFSFEYIFEFDAIDLDRSAISRCSGILTPSSMSNSLKHIEAERKLIEGSSSIALVLEDDILFLEGFFQQLEDIVIEARSLNPGWLIFLGGSDNKLDEDHFDPAAGLLVEKPITTAEAYLIDRVGCLARLDWLKTRKVDRQADHLLKLIDAESGNKQYRTRVPLATQGSITGKFDSKLDSSRQKHGRGYLLARYWFSRFRRQKIPYYTHWLKRLFSEKK